MLVPEEVLTIGELKPGLAEAGITVVEEPTADRSGPALAGQSRTGGRELSGGERDAVLRADAPAADQLSPAATRPGSGR